MIFEQYSHSNNFICVEQQCHFCRVITNWDQLQLHNQFNHKVISRQKFESKVISKLNQFNQQQREKVQEDVYQLIQYQEEKIIFKIQEFFEFFKKMHINIVQEYIYFNDQLQSLSYLYSIETNIQKYIEIFYGQIEYPQQEQVAFVINEIQSKLNLIEDDFINLLEKNSTIENQFPNNIYKQEAPEFNDQIPPELIIPPIGIQENYYQTEFITNQVEQMKYEIEQIQHNQSIPLQQSTYNQTQQIEQDDLNNIPLKGYKQLQLQQQNYFQKSDHIENISHKDDDRLSFQLPSKITNIPKSSNQKSNKDVSKSDIKDYPDTIDNTKQQQNNKNIKKEPPQTIFIGKKFDLRYSHKHLKYSQNNQAFSCHQQGIGLVEGILTLQNNAEIRLKFSESEKIKFQAEIGILSVDMNGYMTQDQKYCINELGNLVSNRQGYKGNFKITQNKEYLISYSSKARMLYFIQGKTEEYLDMDKVKGEFKFYVKLYGLKVSILN